MSIENFDSFNGKYKPDELSKLVYHFIFTTISYLNYSYWLTNRKHYQSDDDLINPFEVFNFFYYEIYFRVGLSEHYTFFYGKKDRSVLDRIKLSEERRKALRNSRHFHVHIDTEIKDLVNEESRMIHSDRICWVQDFLMFGNAICYYLKKFGKINDIEVLIATLNEFSDRFKKLNVDVSILDTLLKKLKASV